MLTHRVKILCCWREAIIACCGLIVLQSTVSAIAHEAANAVQQNQIAKGRVRDKWNLTVPVTVAGRNYSFIVDTGCSSTAFGFNFRRALWPPVCRAVYQTTHTTQDVELFKALPIRIGGTDVHTNELVPCLRLTALSLEANQDIDGILGVDVLRQFVLDINFDNDEFSITRHHECDASFSMLRIDSTSDYGCPHLPVKVNGASSANFLVDTGCGNNGSICKRFNEQSQNADANEALDDGVTFEVSRNVRASRVLIGKLEIGPFEHKRMKMFVADELSKIGLPVLYRYHAVFDFPNSRAYLKKGRHYADGPNWLTCGIRFEREGGETLVVAEVDDGGIGQRHGLMRNDRLLEVDGKPYGFGQPGLFIT